MPEDTQNPPDAAAPQPVDGDVATLEPRILEALRTVRDPEIPLDIVELGLIYELAISPAGDVHVRMTLTTPMCPVAGAMPGQVKAKLTAVPGVREARVDLVWDPPWSPERMSAAAKLQLGLL
jgi:FeS assembly SUF system protein